jgi:transcriptional regulator with XRE-family HTH domain
MSRPRQPHLSFLACESRRAMNTEAEVTEKAVARALGEELRRAREAGGWSRAQFVTRLPSGIGDRTLLAYEHGLRQLTIIRLLELAEALGVNAPAVLSQALQRARLHLQNLVLQVDLRRLLNANNTRFRPLVQWAKNRLNDAPEGVAELTPSAVREMAAFVGSTHHELARYLAKFIPQPAEDDDAEDA